MRYLLYRIDIAGHFDGPFANSATYQHPPGPIWPIFALGNMVAKALAGLLTP
jgi:hypothetical protein